MYAQPPAVMSQVFASLEGLEHGELAIQGSCGLQRRLHLGEVTLKTFAMTPNRGCSGSNNY